MMNALSTYKPQFRAALRWTQRIVLPMALGFLLYFGWQSRDTLTATIANAQPQLLILAKRPILPHSTRRSSNDCK